MKIQLSLVGSTERLVADWIDLPVVPRVGETVNLPGIPQYETVVRTVVWYPLPDEEEGIPESDGPFVYIVLGKRREMWP